MVYSTLCNNLHGKQKTYSLYYHLWHYLLTDTDEHISKEKHAETHINQTIKYYIERKNIKSTKGKATNNIQGNPHKVNS